MSEVGELGGWPKINVQRFWHRSQDCKPTYVARGDAARDHVNWKTAIR